MSMVINRVGKLKAFIKEAWINYPHVMLSHIASTIGAIGIICIYVHQSNNPKTPRTFKRPLFMRPDDPRAKQTHTYYEQGWHEKYGK